MAKTSRMVALALMVLLIPWTAAHAAAPRILVAKVESVSDGATIVAITQNRTKLRIRLLGIHAPEVPHGQKPGQPVGAQARDYLTRLIRGRTIQMETFGEDGYEQNLAVVFLGPINVNVEMVEQGLAEVYRGAPCKAYCRDLRVAEVRAKRDRVGMWAKEAGYESPAAFRKRTKNQGD